jgi:hypothetical protein
LTPNLGGDAMLLIPPKRLNSSDITDFARKFGQKEYIELFENIKNL